MTCLAVSFSLTFLCIVSVHGGSYTSGPFAGHKVVRVTPQNEAEVEQLRTLLAGKNLDFWKEPSCVQCYVDIRLSPKEFADITSALNENGFQTKTLIEDVQALLKRQTKARVLRAPSGSGFDYSRYHTLEELYKWVQNMSVVYKDITSSLNVTQSYEGRPLLALKISTSSSKDKPVFWIHGGIHAREWISPATVIYMVGQMLDNYGKDRELTAIVDMFDWYVLPSLNPDGYAYTWTDIGTRFWRKTRSQAAGLECAGVDPNRNWAFHWGGYGSNGNSCDEQYRGPFPFSEPEIKGLADFLSTIKNLKGFIDFHSYGQKWMTPWGYTEKLPVDYKKQHKGAMLAVEAVKRVHGSTYFHGNLQRTLYTASGGSIDWVYGVLGVKYSYIVELRDLGDFGFLLPADQILPTGEEMLEGLKTIAKYVYTH